MAKPRDNSWYATQKYDWGAAEHSTGTCHLFPLVGVKLPAARLFALCNRTLPHRVIHRETNPSTCIKCLALLKRAKAADA